MNPSSLKQVSYINIKLIGQLACILLMSVHSFIGSEVSPDKLDSTRAPLAFSLSAATPASNLCRLLRALQLPRRALLLEGSPGVGKTSLVIALARAAGHRVVRINLSEATVRFDCIGDLY